MLNNFHIHLYYDESTMQLAKELGAKAREKFSIEVGRFHEKNVGPHPRWSVQLSVPPEIFGEVLTFVAINRNGLTVFSHPDTGESYLDHTDHAIWMGELLELNLESFKK